jgi:hypothetical protein
MRWWPPLLHLSLIAALVPLAWLRIGSVLDDAPAIQAASVQARNDGLAAELPAVPLPVDLEMLFARPLFEPDRRQEAPVPDIAPPADDDIDRADDLRMVGYVNDGGESRAILMLDSNGAQATVREGDVFEGFRIRSIQSSSVIVADQGKEITIKMFDQ